jgi:cobalamin-dependent methionine synthase I
LACLRSENIDDFLITNTIGLLPPLMLDLQEWNVVEAGKDVTEGH